MLARLATYKTVGRAIFQLNNESHTTKLPGKLSRQ
jgi:hypothetical protein